MTRRRIDSVADYLSAFSRGMVLAAAVLVAQSAFAQVPVGPYPSGGVQRVIMPYISGGGVPDGPIFATPGTDCTAGTIPYSYSGDTNTGTTSVAADSVSQCAGATESNRSVAAGLDLGARALLFGSAFGTSDARIRRTGTKTLTVDDGAGGGLSLIALMGPVQGRGYSTTSSADVIAIGTTNAMASGTNGLWSTRTTALNVGVEINTGTAAPTFNNGTVTTGSRNTAGQITLTGGNTGGVVTFGAPNWTNTPFCVVTGSAATDIPQITAASVSAFTVAGITANGVFTYICIGRI